MIKLQFRQFLTEEDLKRWLLGKKEKERESLILPVSNTPEQLMSALNQAEMSNDPKAIRKAMANIEANGYSIKTNRFLVPRNSLKKSAK